MGFHMHARMHAGAKLFCVGVLFFSSYSLAGDDYLDTGILSFTFDQDNVAYEVMVPLINDDIHELNENFFAFLSTQESMSILILNPANATVNILDEEGMTVS